MRENSKNSSKWPFSMRRKTLVNNLTKNLGANKESLISLINHLEKPLTVRAEELSLLDFIYLSDNI
jgi:16S rRNA A1518/A1519 N6-dimethyltransferase RsmA/KsgA/DIM1 with predicted DNA glycosylase/AP lyase activity